LNITDRIVEKCPKMDGVNLNSFRLTDIVFIIVASSSITFW